MMASMACWMLLTMASCVSKSVAGSFPISGMNECLPRISRVGQAVFRSSMLLPPRFVLREPIIVRHPFHITFNS
jgi:hypothetical protein